MPTFKSFLATLFLGLWTCQPIHAQTIAEKKESFHRKDSDMDPASLEQLKEVNRLLNEKRHELGLLYDQARLLYLEKAERADFNALLLSIRNIKYEIREIQEMWRAETSHLFQNEEYALWHQPETTVQQLITEFGASDFLYLIPPEISCIRMCLNSSLPIPRESWGECLDLLLSQYGIGIRQLNPYLRELYILRNDPSAIKGILDSPEQLDFYPSNAPLCYVITPNATDPRADLQFLQRFSNPLTTKIEIVGGKIFVTGQAEAIQEILKLYGFANSGGRRQEFQLVTLSKINAKEMEAILNSAFHSNAPMPNDGSTLRVIPLEHISQSLFLSGSNDDVKKALALIKDVESQIENPQEKTVFWYIVKHSDPEELAAVLAKVYDLLISNPSKVSDSIKPGGQTPVRKDDKKLVVPAIQVGPTMRQGQRTAHKTADGQNNFIVDVKTGAIIMVVEAEALPKIKELLRKLDVPKKMVQIEVLLFEKKISNSNSFGLNLLRIGEGAKNLAQTGLSWSVPNGLGILEFLISRNKGSGIPAYDLAYQFMLGQEDVQINASPSVTTMNQTPATIAIVEEISIDSGEGEKKNRIYTRAEYGVVIQITPTINMDDSLSDTESGFVTLETDITFDTPKKNSNDRPDVTRRHIKNHVRIADGQTVILGGLRRKNTQDNKESIPFLGEIPGLGKLFSHTDMHNDSTEMFVFITPKIIADPVQDAERVKREELKKRPGDIPEFLQELVKAQEKEKRRLFEGSLTMLFGQPSPSVNEPKKTGEYDGK